MVCKNKPNSVIRYSVLLAVLVFSMIMDTTVGRGGYVVADERPSEHEVQGRLFNLINQRLTLMYDVARYKTRHRLPIEDVVREHKVLESSKRAAEAEGLDPVSVEAFFRLQIAAAKAIQYRYRAKWLFDKGDQRNLPEIDLKKEIRPTLLRLGEQINRTLAEFIAAGGHLDTRHDAGYESSDLGQFLEVIDQQQLLRSEKLALFEALRRASIGKPL